MIDKKLYRETANKAEKGKLIYRNGCNEIWIVDENDKRIFVAAKGLKATTAFVNLERAMRFVRVRDKEEREILIEKYSQK